MRFIIGARLRHSPLYFGAIIDSRELHKPVTGGTVAVVVGVALIFPLIYLLGFFAK